MSTSTHTTRDYSRQLLVLASALLIIAMHAKLGLQRHPTIAMISLSVLLIAIYNRAAPIERIYVGVLGLSFFVAYASRYVVLTGDPGLYYYSRERLSHVQLELAATAAVQFYAAFIFILGINVAARRQSATEPGLAMPSSSDGAKTTIGLSLLLMLLATGESYLGLSLLGFAIRSIPIDVFGISLFTAKVRNHLTIVAVTLFLLFSVITARRYAFLFVIIALIAMKMYRQELGELLTAPADIAKTVGLLAISIVPLLALLNLTIEKRNIKAGGEVAAYSYDTEGLLRVFSDGSARLAALDQTAKVSGPARQTTEYGNLSSALQTTGAGLIPGFGSNTPSMGRVMAVEFQGTSFSSPHAGAWTGPGLAARYFPSPTHAGVALAVLSVLIIRLLVPLFNHNSQTSIAIYLAYRLFWQLPISGNFDTILAETIAQLATLIVALKLCEAISINRHRSLTSTMGNVAA